MDQKPRAFEPRRIAEALRVHARVLIGATLLALFGGAAVARVIIPNQVRARASARIARDPHAVVARALDEDVLDQAQQRAAERSPLAALRRRVRVSFERPDRLSVEVVADDEQAARRLANALVEIYVALANQHADEQRADSRRRFSAQLALARAEQERASAALAREGLPGLSQELAAVRERIRALERVLEAEQAPPSPAGERGLSLLAWGGRRSGKRSQQELAAAQRDLSRLLVEHGEQHAQVLALRGRIERLQARALELRSPAVAERVEAGTPTGSAEGRTRQLAQQARELTRLNELSAQVAPLVAREEQAKQRLAVLAVRERELELAGPRSAVATRAALSSVDQLAPRMLVSLLSALVALLSLVVFYAVREIYGLRVCAATELAHWLAAPVLTTSSWPKRDRALEPLVDALADPALDALGVTLVLPLSELERPLAATLATQLNARAQRHYRSATGSRITIAQDWQGELGSSRIQRAAEAADRVLWVVAADAHRGPELARRRALVERKQGVAAVLVDAEPGLARSVGRAHEFWRARSSQLSDDLAAARVPLH